MSITARSLNPQTIAASTVSMASRFIPLPFVDDYLKERSERFVVSRVLREANYTYPVKEVQPLYDDEAQQMLMIRLVKAGVVRGLLYPVRKIARIINSASGIPRDTLRPPLLARAVRIAIDKNLLAPATPEKKRREEAALVREAFNKAMDGISGRVYAAALSDLRRLIRRAETDPEASIANFMTAFEWRFESMLEQSRATVLQTHQDY